MSILPTARSELMRNKVNPANPKQKIFEIWFQVHE